MHINALLLDLMRATEVPCLWKISWMVGPRSLWSQEDPRYSRESEPWLLRASAETTVKVENTKMVERAILNLLYSTTILL